MHFVGSVLSLGPGVGDAALIPDSLDRRDREKAESPVPRRGITGQRHGREEERRRQLGSP